MELQISRTIHPSREHTWNEELLELFDGHVAAFSESDVTDYRVDGNVSTFAVHRGFYRMQMNADDGNLEYTDHTEAFAKKTEQEKMSTHDVHDSYG